MTKTIVKVDQQLIEVDVDKSQYPHRSSDHRVLSEQEAMEHFLLKDKPAVDPDVELQNELNKMVQDVTQQMKDSFKANLKEAVTRMLGFSNTWNRGWEVDHCNGRVSDITHLVTAEVKYFIAEEMKNYKPYLNDKDIKEMVAAIKRDFKEKISYNLRQMVHEELTKQLRDLVGKTVAELLSGQEFEVKKTCLDILKVENYKSKKK